MFVRTFSLLAVAALVSDASAAIIGDDTDTSGNYQVVASPLTDVGGGLLATTVTLENISGDDSFDPIAILNATIGSNGNAHNQQAFGGFAVITSPESFNDTFPIPVEGAATDTHFLAPIQLVVPGEDLAETASTGTSGVDVAPATGGFGGVLTGSYSFANVVTAPSSLDVFQVVFAAGTEVDFAFEVGIPGQTVGSFAASVGEGSVDPDPPLLEGDLADGATIDLTADFLATAGLGGVGNLDPTDIELSNAGEGDLGALGVQIDPIGPTPDGFFDFDPDALAGQVVDLFVNNDFGLAAVSPGAEWSANVTVTSANGGNLSYVVTASVPEPTTVGLLGLVFAGLAGARRRG